MQPTATSCTPYPSPPCHHTAPSTGLDFAAGSNGRYWGIGSKQSPSQVAQLSRALGSLEALLAQSGGPFLAGQQVSLVGGAGRGATACPHMFLFRWRLVGGQCGALCVLHAVPCGAPMRCPYVCTATMCQVRDIQATDAMHVTWPPPAAAVVQQQQQQLWCWQQQLWCWQQHR